MTYGHDYDRVYPTLLDPVIITAADGTLLVCWVQEIGRTQPGLRWVFVRFNRARYIGPAYNGENSLEVIRALVDEWWARKQALGQAED